MAFGITDQAMADLAAQLGELSPAEAAQVAAEAQGELDEGHLVEYAEECVRQTREVDKDRIEKMEVLWQAHEGVLKEYANKDAYQSKIVVSEPYTTCIQAKALVRRAVIEKPDWFSAIARKENDPDGTAKADWWEKVLRYWTTTNDCRMPTIYPAMSEMAFAVGLSMAAKVLWSPSHTGTNGIRIALIEPWKIFRDPDARPMQPQSGLYVIHQDYVDMSELWEGQRTGIYHDIDRVREGTSRQSDGNLDLDEDKAKKRRGQLVSRNKYRKAALVSEFWGDVLDHNGELVLSNQTYTVANGVVIRGPYAAPFPSIRWPIHQFTALPHLMRFAGYGLFEQVLHIWKLRSNLLNLFVDSENWRLNQAFELDPTLLENPADHELYPGKVVRKRAGAPSPVYMPVTVPPMIADFVPFWETTGRMWENGSFVSELMKGESGERRNITAREVELKVNQGLGVFDNIGKDVEIGGVQLLECIKDVLLAYWDDFSSPTWAQVVGADNPILQQLQLIPMMPEERIKFLNSETDFRIAGVTQMFDRQAMLQKLMQFVQLTDSPRFLPYSKDYELIKKSADALGLPEVIKNEQELAEMQLQQMQQQQQQAEAAHAAGQTQPGGGPPLPQQAHPGSQHGRPSLQAFVGGKAAQQPALGRSPSQPATAPQPTQAPGG